METIKNHIERANDACLVVRSKEKLYDYAVLEIADLRAVLANYKEERRTLELRICEQRQQLERFNNCILAKQAEAAPVGADERAAFEKVMNDARFFPTELDFTLTKSPSGKRDEYVNTHLESCWNGWQARAAVAQRAGSGAKIYQAKGPDAPLWEDVSAEIFTKAQANNYDTRIVYTAPPPQPDSGRDAALILPDDLKALKRFLECCEDSDSGGHDISRDRMSRLSEIGVCRHLGFGNHQITAFGDYVLGLDVGEIRMFPLKTFAEYNSDAKAAHDQKLAVMAAQQGEKP